MYQALYLCDKRDKSLPAEITSYVLLLSIILPILTVLNIFVIIQQFI